MSTLSWDKYHADIVKLGEQIRTYSPDIIAPCMVGGLVPGAIIAKQLGITDVRPIDIERSGDERSLAYDVQGDITGKRVVILEDDLPTGKGPVTIKKQFENRGANVKIAAIYVSPVSQRVADYYTEVCEEFFDYPWKIFNCGDRPRD